MTTLQYEDSGYRKKQEQKEKDEFAIGFAEWMNKTENRLGYHETKNEWYHFDSGKWITTKQLLEIYKKEKGL
ncbi:hypothetical protein UFOVP309_8 [uncultured Caudovirales phage]|uniref:Uncharacterized protein n=1 Tax=uncultured Caudovirales phage TaxID=2100421 RepID=A0A6J5PPS0_9CAUD|nr:hypothetical protein UFOVP309_8 [uncultured Caudovirales phage]CAB4172997.1 hypothetical protein UFOVP946_15 [uncultured Caudovirales phage]